MCRSSAVSGSWSSTRNIFRSTTVYCGPVHRPSELCSWWRTPPRQNSFFVLQPPSGPHIVSPNPYRGCLFNERQMGAGMLQKVHPIQKKSAERVWAANVYCSQEVSSCFSAQDPECQSTFSPSKFLTQVFPVLPFSTASTRRGTIRPNAHPRAFRKADLCSEELCTIHSLAGAN